jgi:acetolactate synthase-1/2/3 large subunit
MITGVANATQDGIPLLAITAQTKIENFGRGGLQESSCTAIDTIGIYKNFTRYNTLVSHPKQLEQKVIKAILAAFREPAGAAHLSLPVDITRAPAQQPTLAPHLAELIQKTPLLDTNGVTALFREISAARKICFVLGQGARDAIGRILTLALMLNASVITTPFGKGLVSPYHRQFRGVIGMAGHTSATETLQDNSLDCVIAVGTSLGEFATGNWPDCLLNRRLIHVDRNAEHFLGSHTAQCHIHSDPLQLFEQLELLLRSARNLGNHATSIPPYNAGLIELRQKPRLAYSTEKAKLIHSPALPNCSLNEPEKYLSDAAPIKPQRLMSILPALLPPGTRFVADGTGANFWAIHYLHVPDRRVAERRSALERRSATVDVVEHRVGSTRRRSEKRSAWESLYRCPGEFGSMGWGLGAAIGTAFGNPTVPVVALTGDGSMLMNGQELTVALQHRLSVIFVVLNDRALGTVKHGQRLAGAERLGFELPEVDFSAMAHAMGIDACRIQGPHEFLNLDMAAICKRRQPYLIDVLIDPEEVLPLGGRMKALEPSS